MIITAFQPGDFQQKAFQIIGTIARPDRVELKGEFIGQVPTGALRVITIKPVKNRRTE